MGYNKLYDLTQLLQEGGEIIVKYKFVCPAADRYAIDVEAQNEDEAVEKVKAESQQHLAKVHPEMLKMSDEEIKGMLRSSTKVA